MNCALSVIWSGPYFESKLVVFMASAKRNQKTLRKDSAPTIQYESFRKRFSDFLVAHDLDGKVKTSQLGAFFEIAQVHLEQQASIRSRERTDPSRDHRDSQKLIRGLRKRFEELVSYVNQAEKTRGPLTASLARSSIRGVTALRAKLENYESIIRSQKSLLSMNQDFLKNADVELTIDLINFIAEEFQDCTPSQRNVLIGASFAGAGLFNERTLEEEAGPIGPIPMKVSRAKKRVEGLYGVPGGERNNPSVIGRRKTERMLREKAEKSPVTTPV